jgi:fructose-1,6-bisphosphatase/inositol monophosphatase family enzyme
LAESLVSSNLGYGREAVHIQHTLGTMDALMKRGIRGFRMLGSACTAIANVASGRTSVYYESGPHAWDVCAGAVIVREAGGVVVDMSGRPLDLCSRAYIFAATHELAAEVGRCVVYPIPYCTLTPAPSHCEFP